MGPALSASPFLPALSSVPSRTRLKPASVNAFLTQFRSHVHR